MSKISDEIRVFANTYYPKGHREAYDALFDIAGRIDSETVELPKDRDGVPIHVGETVYGEDGRAWHVEGISLGRWAKWVEGHVVHAMGDSGQWRDLIPEWLTHTRPDSLERIAYDIETVVPIDDEDDERFRRELAHRIRRLAEREDKR